jgi:hypothetical protein
MQLEVPPASVLHVDQLAFDAGVLSADELFTGVIRMFTNANFTTDLNVSHERLCRWVLSVRKNYRDVTYHNWAHAFNVTQCMFFMITHGRLSRFLTRFERHALLIASLCHDLDHRYVLCRVRVVFVFVSFANFLLARM